MTSIAKFRKSIMLAVKIMIIAALVLLMLGFWQTFYTEAIFNNRVDLFIIISYVVVLVAFTSVYGGFRIGVFRVHDLIYSTSLATVFANFVVYMELSLILHDMLPVWYMVLLTVLDVVLITVMMTAANMIYFGMYKPKHILAIFDNDKNMINVDLIRKMNKIKQRYHIERGITVGHGIDEIKAEIDRYEAVLIGDFEKSLKNEILRYCYANHKRIYLLPSMNDIIISNSDRIQISDSPVLVCRNSGLTTEERIIKRVMDVLIAGIGAVIASPVMLVIAIAIKLCDRGPILYKQRRVTENGRTFNVYKFRSMRVDAEAHGAQKAVDDDNRITKVGRVIRPLRLDELPQLFNVLFGHMSIVGPRPERVENVAEYTAQLPEFDLRHRVKAGITGYAQIYGKYNTSPSDKLNMDLIYIEKYSLLMDIKLMFMTIKILFVKESTEGFDKRPQRADSEKAKKDKR